MAGPIGSSTTVAAQNSSTNIDKSDVEFALRQAKSDPSMLAEVLESPNLNDAERDEVIKTLARDPDSRIALYGQDLNPDIAEVRGDYKTIANAIEHAYQNGAISKSDLLNISDENKAGNGAQRLVSLLSHGDTKRAGGTMDALGDALSDRGGNNGLDSKGAVLAYTSDAGLMRTNLNTPAKRAAAFETLVSIGENPLIQSAPSGLKSDWAKQALAGSGRLFAAHGQELVDAYTASKPGQLNRTEILAKFMGQTVFNPDAKSIPLDGKQNLAKAVSDALGKVSDGLMARAEKAPKGSVEQSRAIEELGSFTASVSGGAAAALTKYSDKIRANEKSREEFANFVGAVIGDIVGSKVPAGNTAGFVASKVVKSILDIFAKNPARPGAELANVLFDQFQSRVDLMRTNLKQPELLSAFNAAYSAELLQLQQALNINLGAHEK